MYFDEVLNQKGFWVGILLVSFEGVHTLVFIKLDFDVTDSVIECEAYIIRL